MLPITIIDLARYLRDIAAVDMQPSLDGWIDAETGELPSDLADVYAAQCREVWANR